MWPSGQHIWICEEEEYHSLVLSADLRPDLILEVVSENTHEADTDVKHEIYRLAGIREYWLYDPGAYAGEEPLRGWQLVDTEYMPILGWDHESFDEAITRYPSVVLQTDWGLTANAVLQLWDPQRKDWYRTTPVAQQQFRNRAEQAEIENARLCAMLNAQADKDQPSEPGF